MRTSERALKFLPLPISMKHVKLYHSQVIQVIPTSDHSCARDPYKYTANIRSVQGTLPLPNPIGDNMLIVRVTTVYGLHILLFIPCQHELDYPFVWLVGRLFPSQI